MKAAGIADICNTFARIFQKAAGLKKAYAVQMIHNRAAGCAAEKPAEMIFGNIKMGSDIIQGKSVLIMLPQIGKDACGQRPCPQGGRFPCSLPGTLWITDAQV